MEKIGIYLFLDDGLCIYSKGFSKIDEQLVGGFGAAITSFASQLIENRSVPDLLDVHARFGNQDLTYRVITGEGLHALVIIKQKQLSDEASLELDELAKSLVKYVKKNYDLNDILGNKELDDYLEKEIKLRSEHMYSAYLVNILGMAANYYGVKEERSKELIREVNRIYEETNNIDEIRKRNDEIASEICQMASEPKSKTFKGIIKYVNEHHADIWDLFNVPLIKKNIYS